MEFIDAGLDWYKTPYTLTILGPTTKVAKSQKIKGF